MQDSVTIVTSQKWLGLLITEAVQALLPFPPKGLDRAKAPTEAMVRSINTTKAD